MCFIVVDLLFVYRLFPVRCAVSWKLRVMILLSSTVCVCNAAISAATVVFNGALTLRFYVQVSSL